ncbi:MAG: transglycosylase domain-containing protein, partial [Sciscionella sp.]
MPLPSTGRRALHRFTRWPRTQAGVIRELVVIVAVSIVGGALIAGLALPWVGLAAKGAQQASAGINQQLPVPLVFKPLNQRTVVLAADGTPITSFYDENRVAVGLSAVAPVMRRSIVAIEDSRFYEHGAIDVRGTLRAFVQDQGGITVQGGSTITQQLVKLTLIEQATTRKAQLAAIAEDYARKLKELRYAIWVDDHYTKDQILQRYLNTAYFGDGAYGIESAAHHFFSTTAAKLTLTQAALIAGLVQDPTHYNPVVYPNNAKQRRNTVLFRMWQLHEITRTQSNQAQAAPLGLKVAPARNGCVSSTYPFYCDYVLHYLLKDPALGKT